MTSDSCPHTLDDELIRMAAVWSALALRDHGDVTLYPDEVWIVVGSREETDR